MKNVILGEYTVYISVKNGLKIIHRKYKVKKTKKNYISDGTDYDCQEFWPLRERISLSDECKIRYSSYDTDIDSIKRTIYYEETETGLSKESARTLVREEMDKVVKEFKDNAEKIYDLWFNRNANKKES